VRQDIEVGDPGPGEVRIKVEAVGLNRSEAMYRAGRSLAAFARPTIRWTRSTGRWAASWSR